MKYWLNDFKLVKSRNGKMGVDWSSEVGKSLEFYYFGIRDYVHTTGFDKDTNRIKFIYNDREFDMYVGHFKACKLGRVLGKFTPEYLYDVGDIVNETSLILERVTTNDSKHNKAYMVKCLIDGYISPKPIREDSIKNGRKCPVCDNQVIVRGINDVATTHPHLVKYFVNVNDAYTNSYAARKKISIKCLDCGCVKKVAMYSFSAIGYVPCDKCGDGVSYPEKVMFSILDQLHLDFTPEYSPSWANGRRYDFYVPSKRLIIEMDGGLGHGKENNMTNISSEESLAIDKIKDGLANKNRINVVRIDCTKSEIEYIKNNISNSTLSEVFNIENIDWELANKEALCSRVKKACDLWNNGIKSTSRIAEILNIARTTACNYLKKGAFVGMCSYTTEDGRYYSYKLNRNGKPLDVILNGEILKTYKSCADVERNSISDFGVFLNKSNVAAVANGKRNIYKGYVFRYI